jgi:hypothetical protein
LDGAPENLLNLGVPSFSCHRPHVNNRDSLHHFNRSLEVVAAPLLTGATLLSLRTARQSEKNPARNLLSPIIVG